MRILAVLVVAVSACASSAKCTTGQSIACACPGGGSGVQVCQANDTYDACDCGTQMNGNGKKVFITSAGYNGSLEMLGGAASGVAGGDALCNNAATGAGLSGTFKAWLSDDTTDAVTRIADVGPWYTIDGGLVFKNRAAMSGLPMATISTDENGEQGVVDQVWTGTATGGRKEYTCTSWTMQADHGTLGLSNSTQEWTDQGVFGIPCSTTARLYCFEQ